MPKILKKQLSLDMEKLKPIKCSLFNNKICEIGALDFILNKLNISNGYFIDIGTYNRNSILQCLKLLDNGWGGSCIQANIIKFNYIKNIFEKKNVSLFNSIISYYNNDNLDTFLDIFLYKKNIDVLTINVGGLEYNIFKSINIYLPKVICLKVNPGLPPDYNEEYIDDIARFNIGNSLTVINNEAIIKGYFSFCYTGYLYLIQYKYINLFYDLCGNKSIIDLYTDYLFSLDYNDLEYLYKLFVIKKYYNGIWINNKILNDFYNKNIKNFIDNYEFDS